MRWLLAACCMIGSAKFMVMGLIAGLSSQPGAGGAVAAWPVLVSFALFLVTVFLIAPETALRAAEWCARPFTNILFPSDEFSKPPLSYKLARRYRDEHRWEEAATQYRKIIRYYPEEKDAYMELFDVADALGDKKLRRKYTALFNRRFHEKTQAIEQ